MKLFLIILFSFQATTFAQSSGAYKVANRSFPMYTEPSEFSISLFKQNAGGTTKNIFKPCENSYCIYKSGSGKDSTISALNLFAETDAELENLVRLEKRFKKYFSAKDFNKNYGNGSVVAIRYKQLFFNHFLCTSEQFLASVKEKKDLEAFRFINKLADILDK